MGRVVLIYGKSGSGKSRSLKNFNEDEIFLINVEGKDLPFRKTFKYETITDNYDKIQLGLTRMPVKTAVIDDAGYLLTNMFMRGHAGAHQGNQLFEFYNEIGDKFWGLFKFIKHKLPKDVIVYVIMHEDSLSDGKSFKLKTIGKLLDEKVCLEGMVTICLRCMSKHGKHYFVTHTDGDDITKSPEDMFSDTEIDNDLKAVDTAIREYYGMKGLKE
ncbi:MAG: AAA family ATPase [Ruminococcus sp.]|nr:AAA family ATPase [Ruminococcus sp.]MBQ1351006.1 AAA family ATPase [Ruminococcus sp.]